MILVLTLCGCQIVRVSYPCDVFVEMGSVTIEACKERQADERG
jgi:hypothetical protein